jgi:hypothetical protein
MRGVRYIEKLLEANQGAGELNFDLLLSLKSDILSYQNLKAAVDVDCDGSRVVELRGVLQEYQSRA